MFMHKIFKFLLMTSTLGLQCLSECSAATGKNEISNVVT